MPSSTWATSKVSGRCRSGGGLGPRGQPQHLTAAERSRRHAQSSSAKSAVAPARSPLLRPSVPEPRSISPAMELNVLPPSLRTKAQPQPTDGPETPAPVLERSFRQEFPLTTPGSPVSVDVRPFHAFLQRAKWSLPVLGSPRRTPLTPCISGDRRGDLPENASNSSIS